MKIGIIGTGAYGLALAKVLSEGNHRITMWSKLKDEIEELSTKRENKQKLPGVTLPEEIVFTSSLSECLGEKQLIVWAIPAEYMKDTLKEALPFLEEKQTHCLTSKGLEQDGTFLHETFEKITGTSHFVLLSGPSFAKDIIQNFPTGLSLASKDSLAIDTCRNAFSHSNVKLRLNDDLIGTAICGALKNVFAIASGILSGLGAPESTKAMFLTESLHDLKELIGYYQGQEKTVLSYAGFGDLLLTCNSNQSRNYQFGEILARNLPEETQNYLKMHTVEGFQTLEIVYRTSREKEIPMPLVTLIHNIVYEKDAPSSLLTFLLEKK